MYFIIAIAIIAFSVLTVTTRKILRSATYLLFVLFATAALYFQMDYHFLGAVQIAVYAGGIVVLFVFAMLDCIPKFCLEILLRISYPSSILCVYSCHVSVGLLYL